MRFTYCGYCKAWNTLRAIQIFSSFTIMNTPNNTDTCIIFQDGVLLKKVAKESIAVVMEAAA